MVHAKETDHLRLFQRAGLQEQDALPGPDGIYLYAQALVRQRSSLNKIMRRFI
jgi:hypothetical protein